MTEIAAQAGKILGPLSGVATTWAVDLGLRLGVFEHLAGRPDGADAEQVAGALGLEALYTKVVLRAAYAGEILEQDAGRYRLAEHMDTLLLDSNAPAYVAGAVQTFVALRETFVDLRWLARSGEREWWADFDPEWIEAVGENGQTYYRRMLDAVVPRLTAVQAVLERGARYLDLACGVCRGPAKVVAAFPDTRVTAVDCDRYSLAAAERELKERGMDDRFTFVQSFLEDLDLDGGHDLAIINISLHGARDIQRAVNSVHRALDEGGVFLISEFLPGTRGGHQDGAGPADVRRAVVRGAHRCQLLPTSRFVALLEAAGFSDVGTIDVTPTHVVIHGTK